MGRKKLSERKIRDKADLARALLVGVPAALVASWLLSAGLSALLGLFR